MNKEAMKHDEFLEIEKNFMIIMQINSSNLDTCTKSEGIKSGVNSPTIFLPSNSST